MQAIQSKVIPPSDKHGARIKAWCGCGSITLPYPDGDQQEAHVFVVDHLIAKFVVEDKKTYNTPTAENPWNRARAVGQLPNGDYCHVFIC